MKKVVGFAVLAMACGMAQAQQRVDTPPVPEGNAPRIASQMPSPDLTEVCVYANQIYSIGSNLNGMVCAKPSRDVFAPDSKAVWQQAK